MRIVRGLVEPFFVRRSPVQGRRQAAGLSTSNPHKHAGWRRGATTGALGVLRGDCNRRVAKAKALPGRSRVRSLDTTRRMARRANVIRRTNRFALSRSKVISA